MALGEGLEGQWHLGPAFDSAAVAAQVPVNKQVVRGPVWRCPATSAWPGVSPGCCPSSPQGFVTPSLVPQAEAAVSWDLPSAWEPQREREAPSRAERSWLVERQPCARCSPWAWLSDPGVSWPVSKGLDPVSSETGGSWHTSRGAA